MNALINDLNTEPNKNSIEESLVNIRTFLVNTYEKHTLQLPTSDLEKQIIDVLLMHPQYLVYMTKEHIKTQFEEDNPFFHIGLHLGIREQIATNRPQGILAIYANLCEKMGYHEAEHAMIDCLQHHLRLSQNNPNMSDAQYLEDLQTL